MPVRRPHFFAGQLLTADDLNTLVDHIDRSHRETLLALRGPGVVQGLRVRVSRSPTTAVVVEGGVAIDPSGRLVTLEAPISLPVAAAAVTGTVVLTVQDRPVLLATPTGDQVVGFDVIVGVEIVSTTDPTLVTLASYRDGRRVRTT